MSAATPTSRDVRTLIHGAASGLAGKKRTGEPVHRQSYDADLDPRAKPWSRIGDGSTAQGIAHREALLQAAEELYQQQWREFPAAVAREKKAARMALAAELHDIESMSPAERPIGRPATIRLELSQISDWLERAAGRLRRFDAAVLKALIRHVDFATGRLIPALETIAKVAGCHRNYAIAALRRLKAHGLIDWVRRSVRTGNDGEFAPQREQTSNAYFFDHRRRMAGRTWQRYLQLLLVKLRRLGSIPAGVDRGASREISDPELRATLDRVSALVTNAST